MKEKDSGNSAASGGRGQAPSWLGHLFRMAAAIYVLATLAAIGIQDHSGALPQGLFNEGREGFRLLSNLCLAGAMVVLAAFVLEAAKRRENSLGRGARGLLVSFLILELLLAVLDATLMSGDATSRLGGPYHQLWTPAEEPVFVRKSHPASALGFRTDLIVSPALERPRLLFLGDSYTEGSGRELACNYPDVVERTLSSRRPGGVEVMNAGVGGYGPLDALRLLELLEAEGWQWNGLVFNLFLENDFTDNLPGTERRVMAGVNMRFPRSAFLFWFHPLNSRTFRFPLFLVRVGSIMGGLPAYVVRDSGSCEPDGESLDRLTPRLRGLVERRLAANYDRAASYATISTAVGAIGEMERIAAAKGKPLVLVLFPDRVLVDERLREELGIDDGDPRFDLQRLRRRTLETFADLPVVDTTSFLEGRTELYRARDTHLSDLGNVLVGEYVAAKLFDLAQERASLRFLLD